MQPGFSAGSAMMERQRRNRNSRAILAGARKAWGDTLTRYAVVGSRSKLNNKLLHAALKALVFDGREGEAFELSIAAACRMQSSAGANNSASIRRTSPHHNPVKTGRPSRSEEEQEKRASGLSEADILRAEELTGIPGSNGVRALAAARRLLNLAKGSAHELCAECGLEGTPNAPLIEDRTDGQHYCESCFEEYRESEWEEHRRVEAPDPPLPVCTAQRRPTTLITRSQRSLDELRQQFVAGAGRPHAASRATPLTTSAMPADHARVLQPPPGHTALSMPAEPPLRWIGGAQRHHSETHDGTPADGAASRAVAPPPVVAPPPAVAPPPGVAQLPGVAQPSAVPPPPLIIPEFGRETGVLQTSPLSCSCGPPVSLGTMQHGDVMLSPMQPSAETQLCSPQAAWAMVDSMRTAATTLANGVADDFALAGGMRSNGKGSDRGSGSGNGGGSGSGGGGRGGGRGTGGGGSGSGSGSGSDGRQGSSALPALLPTRADDEPATGAIERGGAAACPGRSTPPPGEDGAGGFEDLDDYDVVDAATDSESDAGDE